jgi:hypothetical protein
MDSVSAAGASKEDDAPKFVGVPHQYIPEGGLNLLLQCKRKILIGAWSCQEKESAVVEYLLSYGYVPLTPYSSSPSSTNIISPSSHRGEPNGLDFVAYNFARPLKDAIVE